MYVFVVPAVEVDEVVGLANVVEEGSSSGSGEHVVEIGGSPSATGRPRVQILPTRTITSQ